MELQDIQLNLSLPGYKNRIDLEVLSQRVRDFQRPIKIVDIGSYTGIATWHLAKNSYPGSVVYAIDPWTGEDLNPGRKPFIQNWVPGMFNTFEFFQKNIADCDNIIPIKGYAPDCWNGERVDLVFIDLYLGPEGTEQEVDKNLKYWQSHLNPGGLICGYHYAPKTHPGYESEKPWYRIPVQRHAAENGYSIVNPDYTWLWFLEPRKRTAGNWFDLLLRKLKSI